MKSLLRVLKSKNIATGYLYFYIHLITEIASFYFLTTLTNGARFVWLIPFIYDGLAFVPQALMGYVNDKKPKMVFSNLGIIFLICAYLLYFCTSISKYISLIIVCLGNAFIHVNGAEVTLRCSEGKLSHSAIFVAGGSFGVILGKIFANSLIPFWIIILFILTMIPFILLAETYKKEKIEKCNFNYVNKKINPNLVIILAVFVVIVRGYLGYGIPTSWNKTIIQAVYLYFIMGIGKALGGILSDWIGIRKVAVISTILAVPFLCFGDDNMFISLIGVMFFSMTMSITLGILVSVLKSKPGLAFGLTTIGLFLGTVPIFFIGITNEIVNIAMITIMSFVCTFILLKILKKEGKENGVDL